MPDVAPGPRCGEPYDCPFLARCWPTLPEHHMSTLYKGGRQVEALLAGGVELIRRTACDRRPAGARGEDRSQLLEYCAQDTHAMVEVVKRLRQLA